MGAGWGQAGSGRKILFLAKAAEGLGKRFIQWIE